MKIRKINYYGVQLYLMSSIFENESLERIIFTIGKAIEECGNNIDNAENTFNEDYYESVQDTEIEIVENLLGSAFIVCQTFITSMVSTIIKFHEFQNRQTNNIKFATTSDNKVNILLYGEKSDIMDKHGNFYSKVQLIDAFANYFKHRDEKGFDWENPNDRSKNTVKIIKDAGLKEGGSNNLRTASECLGNTVYIETEIFSNMIYKWANSLHNGYKAEFSQKGLI